MPQFVHKLQKIAKDEKYAKSEKAPKGSPPEVKRFFKNRAADEAKHGRTARRLAKKYDY